MSRRLKHIIVYGSLILLTWILAGLGAAAHNRRPVREFVPRILNETSNHFLDVPTVQELAQDVQGKRLDNCRIGEVKLPQIEAALRSNPYVETAEVWNDLSGAVRADLVLRRPIARVMPDSGASWYLDRSFHRMETSPRYTASVPLIRGEVERLLARTDTAGAGMRKRFRDMLLRIDGDPFLQAQVSEISLNRKGEVMIYPEIGDVDIDFGKPERVQEKFDNLLLFYRKVLNTAGWTRYRSLSLRYKGIVVARK